MNETLPDPVYYGTTPTTAPISNVPIHDAFGGAATLSTTVNYNLMDLVQMGIVYAFILAAALSALFIFIGGISFILSGGNEEKIKKAVNSIRYSIVGLIVTILSFTFVMILGRMFGLNLMEYISYEEIKNSINQITSGFSEQSKTQQPYNPNNTNPTTMPQRYQPTNTGVTTPQYSDDFVVPAYQPPTQGVPRR